MTTLSKGKRLLERRLAKLDNNSTTAKVLPGDLAWLLYDTFGFPLDLTALIAEEKGLTIDKAGYEAAMQKSQLASKVGGASGLAAAQLDLNVHDINDLRQKTIPMTDDSHKYNYIFSPSAGGGSKTKPADDQYVFASCSARIVAIKSSDGHFVEQIATGQECLLILDKTCLYAEQGGQIYDLGSIVKQQQRGSGPSGDNIDADHTEFFVKNVQIRGGYVAHVGLVEGTALAVGDEVCVSIDDERRRHVMNNHTATHVLNFALRQVLGDEQADQRGSLVAPDRLRFDFAASKGGMTPDQIDKVEQLARDIIKNNAQVYAAYAPLVEAKGVKGLRAIFDETYPDPVRIVSIGTPVQELLKFDAAKSGLQTSVEFCGGTHLQRSGHIGDFVVVSEEAIARGIRRIVAVTGPDAARSLQHASVLHDDLQAFAKEATAKNASSDPKMLKQLYKQLVDLTDDVSREHIPYVKRDALRAELKKIKSQLDEVDKNRKALQLKAVVDQAKATIEKHPDEPYYVLPVQEAAVSNPKAMEAALKEFRSIITCKESPVMLMSRDDELGGKMLVQCDVPASKQDKLNAKEWIQQLLPLLGSGSKAGGSQKAAQATGTTASEADVQKAVALAQEFARMKLLPTGQ